MISEMLIVAMFCSFVSGLLAQAFISEMIDKSNAKRRESFTPPF